MWQGLQEIGGELRDVVLARGGVFDAVVPPLLFLLLFSWLGFGAAAGGALLLAAGVTVWRLARGHAALPAVGGLAGVGLAIVLALVLDREEGFFLPGIVTGAVTVILAVGSNLAGRPMVAWTSYLARRWPLAWYWHLRVRPAYTEVTWLWAAYFLARLLLQVWLFRTGDAAQLAGLSVALGWPATLVLLIVSYVYGTWRLRRLGGPSVEEFKADAPPPWESQRRGF
jgi:hypothetical protein